MRRNSDRRTSSRPVSWNSSSSSSQVVLKNDQNLWFDLKVVYNFESLVRHYTGRSSSSRGLKTDDRIDTKSVELLRTVHGEIRTVGARSVWIFMFTLQYRRRRRRVSPDTSIVYDYQEEHRDTEVNRRRMGMGVSGGTGGGTDQDVLDSSMGRIRYPLRGVGGVPDTRWRRRVSHSVTGPACPPHVPSWGTPAPVVLVLQPVRKGTWDKTGVLHLIQVSVSQGVVCVHSVYLGSRLIFRSVFFLSVMVPL
jgi:hypothetical protein